MSEQSRGDFQKSWHRGGTLIPCAPDSTSPKRSHSQAVLEKNPSFENGRKTQDVLVNVLYSTALNQTASRPRLHISKKKNKTEKS